MQYKTVQNNLLVCVSRRRAVVLNVTAGHDVELFKMQPNRTPEEEATRLGNKRRWVYLPALRASVGGSRVVRKLPP